MDPLAYHLLIQLFRRGDFDADDAAEIADRLEAEGDTGSAHLARAALVEALASDETEAEWRRSRFRVIENEVGAPLDGGNGND